MNIKLHIEIIRIVASIFVIYNHTGTMGFELYSLYAPNTLIYWIMLFFSILCKISVPLFFMISGALLLKKDLTVRHLWTSRIPRIIIVLICTSFIYYIFTIRDDFSMFSLKSLLSGIYTNGISVHLWYLYAYIVFLMCHPFLRAIVKSLSEKSYQYLICIYVIYSLLPVIEYNYFNLSLTNNAVPTWLLTNILVFPLIGYYIENIIDISKISFKNKIFIHSLSLAVISLSVLLTHNNFINLGYATQSYHSLCILLPCISIYITIKDFTNMIKLNGFTIKLIEEIGKTTFGVYLMHLVIPIRGELIDLLINQLQLPDIFVAFSYCILIFVACSFVTWILKKVPIIKNIL